MDDAPKLVDALEWRDISLGGETGGGNEKSSSGLTAVRCTDGPSSRLDVEFRSNDHGLERHIFGQVENFVGVIKIGLQFFPIGIVSAPVPVFVDLWDRKFVDGDFAVHPGASLRRSALPAPGKELGGQTVDVPSPSPSERCTSIVNDSLVAGLSKFVQQICATWSTSQYTSRIAQMRMFGPTKAGSNDQDVHVQIISIRSFVTATMGKLGQLCFQSTVCWNGVSIHCCHVAPLVSTARVKRFLVVEGPRYSGLFIALSEVRALGIYLSDKTFSGIRHVIKAVRNTRPCSLGC